MSQRNLLYSSDYAPTQLAYKHTASFYLPSGFDGATTTFAHGLPFTPLVVGQWSMNSNFTPCYDFTQQHVLDGGFETQFYIGADGTNIKAYATRTNPIDYSAVSNVTIYVRVFSFIPPTYSGPLKGINDNTAFRFNTDFKYPKLFKSGVVEVPKTASGVTVSHGLGYTPTCRVWGNTNVGGTVMPCGPICFEWQLSRGAITGCWTDAEKLTIDNSIYGGQAFYHIYLEDIADGK